DRAEALLSRTGRTAKLHERHLLEESAQHLHPVAALAALAPGLEEGAVVVVVGRDLQLTRGAALDRHLDAALALGGGPDTVVEAELPPLVDVAGEVAGGDRGGGDVEGRPGAVGVAVGHLELDGAPGGALGRADGAALPGGGGGGQAPPAGKGEVDQLD